MSENLYPCQKKMLEVCERRIFELNAPDYTVEVQMRSKCFVLDKIMKSFLKLDRQRGIQETYVDEQLKKGLIGVCDRECPYNKG